MNAEEARKLATEKNNKEDQESIKSIENTIKSAVDKGNFSCYYYKSITKGVVAYFQAQGYVLDYTREFMGEGHYKISW